MAATWPGWPQLTAILAATIIIGAAVIWGAFALWYQALSVLLWSGGGLIVLAALWRGAAAAGLLTFAAAFGGLLLWWRRIAPSNDRVWADELARAAVAQVDGSRVTLQNVRNFDWRSRTDYTQRWETRRYDLRRLISVDMIMSHWMGPMIAHMLISFGFDDGEHLAFSVEVRRERNESFSEIGGFFKQFELTIIAADERDAVRVRTNVRREEAYLYRLRLPVSAMRSLFLGYVEEINALVRAPRFYNTITVNCTTLIYHMMKRIVGYLPLSYRLLLSGYLPAYVYGVGGLDPRYSLQELQMQGRITLRARQADRSVDFSRLIRDGIPNLVSPDPADEAVV
jgi:Domain of unknown function (DUF4105)